jgi:hypothetical protein
MCSRISIEISRVFYLYYLSPSFSPVNPSKASSRSLSKSSIAKELLKLEPENVLSNQRRKYSRRKDMASFSILFSHHLKVRFQHACFLSHSLHASSSAGVVNYGFLFSLCTSYIILLLRNILAGEKSLYNIKSNAKSRSGV